MATVAFNYYTPADAAPYYTAEMEAQRYRTFYFNPSGAGGFCSQAPQMACNQMSSTQVALTAGIYSNQGYLVGIEDGTTVQFDIPTVNAGQTRNDFICADFTRHSTTDTSDTHVFTRVAGPVVSGSTGTDPTLQQDDLRVGGNRRQEALYRVVVSGTSISRIDRVAPRLGYAYLP